jgi:hypothetical protein
MLTYDEAQAMAEKNGITLAHDCDEPAKECDCFMEHLCAHGQWRSLRVGHIPGDNACPNRVKHTACSYDQQTCEMLPMRETTSNLLPLE